jgi:hypothetical protein
VHEDNRHSPPLSAGTLSTLKSVVTYGPYKRYTDPDPNIRFEMMRQQQWRKGG